MSALDSIGGTQALLDSTDITQSAHSRIAGLRDGTMGFTVFMDTANAHPVLSALPTTDELMTFLAPPLAQGSPAACLNAKQVGYDPTRGTDGSLMMKVEGQGNAYALEWGVQLTAGLRTDTTATTGTNFDQGAAFSTPSFPLTTVPVTNTSPLPATVVISSGTVGTVTINGVSAGSGGRHVYRPVRPDDRRDLYRLADVDVDAPVRVRRAGVPPGDQLHRDVGDGDGQGLGGQLVVHRGHRADVHRRDGRAVHAAAGDGGYRDGPPLPSGGHHGHVQLGDVRRGR